MKLSNPDNNTMMKFESYLTGKRIEKEVDEHG
jgi:hypothetical protein